jgi:hypothetical protein
MEHGEIQKSVGNQVEQWMRLQSMRKRPFELSSGAVQALTAMIVNIQQDPSPRWADFDVDATQRVAISMIPNALADMLSNFRRPDHSSIITSWEIWHSLSRALDRWCPVPKDL